MNTQIGNPLEGHWVYVGKYGKQGLRHRVLWIDADENMVYTWSDSLSVPHPTPDGGVAAGWSWMGEWPQFLKEFRR